MGTYNFLDTDTIIEQATKMSIPDIFEAEGEEGMKIDPARLLGPRLQGSNLYFVGMMGSGKSAVGDIVARSECSDVFCFVLGVEVSMVGTSAHDGLLTSDACMCIIGGSN